MENKFLGTIVECENERWYVDNTDDEFKDEAEEMLMKHRPTAKRI